MSTDLNLHSLLLFNLRKNNLVYLYGKRKIVYLILRLFILLKNLMCLQLYQHLKKINRL